MRSRGVLLLCALVCAAGYLSASIFGAVRGIVHDPQHRPVQGAMVMLRAKSSEWSKSSNTNSNGEFEFSAVPVGEYTVTVANPGFRQAGEDVLVKSDTEPVVHFQLSVEVGAETVNVSAAPESVPTDTATPESMINRTEIRQTPGADRTNSLSMHYC